MECRCGGKAMRQAMHDFGWKTTFHGIPEVLNEETYFKRILWVFLTLLGVGLFAYLMVQLSWDFQQSPTTMKTSSTALSELATIEIGFLAFEDAKVRQLNLNDTHMLLILARLQNPAVPYMLASPAPLAGFNTTLSVDIAKIMNQAHVNFTGLMDKLSVDVEDVFWNDDENMTDGTYFWSTLKNETRQNLEKVIDNRGVTFRAKIFRRAGGELSGSDFLGLRINDLGDPPKWPPATAATKLKYQKYYYFQIGDQRKAIVPGYSYEISVAVTETRLLNKYSQPCQMENQLPIAACLQACSDVRKECDFGCQWFTGNMSSKDPTAFCTTFTQKAITGKCTNQFKNCTKSCITPCISKRYVLTSLQIENPTLGAMIDLYFTVQDNGYMTVLTEEYIYTWSILMSNIGGTLGLCLGASVLSVVHFIYFWFDKCLCAAVGRKEKVSTLKSPMEEVKEEPVSGNHKMQ